MILSLEQGFSTCERLPPPPKPIPAALEGTNNCSLVMKLVCTYVCFKGDTVSIEKSHSLKVTSLRSRRIDEVCCKPQDKDNLR